jgi:hypothetical protein
VIINQGYDSETHLSYCNGTVHGVNIHAVSRPANTGGHVVQYCNSGGRWISAIIDKPVNALSEPEFDELVS